MKRVMQKRERGAFAVAFAIFMLAIIGFISLSMDLSQVYVRQTEMQGAADAAAVAAARELDGTQEGVDNARGKARAVFSANSYSYWDALPWNADLMSFARSPDGPWIPDAAVNAANVDALRYVRIDTGAGSSGAGVVQMTFNAGSAITVRKVAIAGPTAMQLVPLAICAISTDSNKTRDLDNGKQERIPFGFRVGVNYNLLNLDPVPGLTSVARHYLVNPIDFPPAANNPTHFLRQHVGPFVCSGTMPFASSRKVYVTPGFPSFLAAELNSRFGDYTGNRCVPSAAVPDKNIREYDRNIPGYKVPDPTAYEFTAAAAAAVTSDGNAPDPGAEGMQLNVAHLKEGPTDGNVYGTLWAYAKPLTTTGAPFIKNDWPSLYKATSNEPKADYKFSDAQDPPYFTYALTPASPSALRFRRVMGVPLLECPVPASGEAKVLGIGKFLLTVKAVDSATNPRIEAEFGGVLKEWGGLAISSGVVK